MRHAFKTESTPLNFILHTSDNGEPWAINQRTFDILSTYLQDDTTLSPTDVAKNIDELFPLNRPQEGDQENEDVTSFLLEMWGVVICLAEQIPWDDPRQKKLVEVIQALKDLPGPKTIQMDDWGAYAVWLDLPLLGPALIENGSCMLSQFIYAFSYLSFCRCHYSHQSGRHVRCATSHSFPPTKLSSICSAPHPERSCGHDLAIRYLQSCRGP